MSSTNSGPSVTTTPNVVVQAVPAGSPAVPFDPSSVAITGGTIAKGLVFNSGNKIAIVGNSIVNQITPRTNQDVSWNESTAVSLNTYNRPTVFDLSAGLIPLRFKATAAGTTGAVEPLWPTTVGGAVQDGSVTWTAELDTNQPSWGWAWWHIAQALSGQRLDEVFIAGRSGKQSNDILLYLDRALASGADIIYFANMLENDCWPGVAPTLATITTRWAAVSAAMDRCRSLGRRVMTQTLLPSGNYDSNGTTFAGYTRGNSTKAYQWLNAQLREYARTRPDVIFFDPASLYVDANTANPVWPENTVTYLSQAGTGQQLKKTDGIHPYMAAAWLIGTALASVLAANFQAVYRFGTASDLNSVSINPGNFGTAGTVGAGVTGTVPNGMTLAANGTGAAVTSSQVARTDGVAGQWLQGVYTATTGDNLSYGATSGLALGNFAVGDVVQAFCEVKILANPTLLPRATLFLRFPSATPGGSNGNLLTGTTDHDIGQFITSDTAFVLKTLPTPIPGNGASTLQPFAQIYGRGAASFTAQVGRMSIVRPFGIPALA